MSTEETEVISPLDQMQAEKNENEKGSSAVSKEIAVLNAEITVEMERDSTAEASESEDAVIRELISSAFMQKGVAGVSINNRLLRGLNYYNTLCSDL